ncbi:MAG TPA: LysR family transcriptional regulator [Gemmatimonadaceae bacterium]|nr:LysR family transcriptional regulator [Gemmatimonadaceae bacterium]
MRLELRDLRLSVAMGQFKTLTQAAEHLNLTPSALSHQLADLERRLGAQLFERSGRRLIATQLGELLCTNARKALAGVEEVERVLGEATRGRDSWLRIAADCYTSFAWLPPVMDSFSAAHPSVEVRIIPEATSDAFGALVRGAIDLSIMSMPVHDRRVRTVRLVDDELVLVVSSRHRLAKHASVDPDELRAERFLAYSPPESNNAFQQILMPAGMSPKQVTVLQLTEALLEATRANMGVTILARWALRPHLERGGLKAVRINHAAAHRTWTAAVRATRPTPAYVDDFIRFLSMTMAAPPRDRPEFAVVRTLSSLGRQRKARAARSYVAGGGRSRDA